MKENIDDNVLTFLGTLLSVGYITGYLPTSFCCLSKNENCPIKDKTDKYSCRLCDKSLKAIKVYYNPKKVDDFELKILKDICTKISNVQCVWLDIERL